MIISNRRGMYELPKKLMNNLKLRTLGNNIRKISNFTEL